MPALRAPPLAARTPVHWRAAALPSAMPPLQRWRPPAASRSVAANSFAAVGGTTQAGAVSGIAIGANTISGNANAIAIGGDTLGANAATATGLHAIAMGFNSDATGASNVAIGDSAQAGG